MASEGGDKSWYLYAIIVGLDIDCTIHHLLPFQHRLCLLLDCCTQGFGQLIRSPHVVLLIKGQELSLVCNCAPLLLLRRREMSINNSIKIVFKEFTYTPNIASGIEVNLGYHLLYFIVLFCLPCRKFALI